MKPYNPLLHKTLGLYGFLWLNKKVQRKLCGICEISWASLSKAYICVIISIEMVLPIDGCHQKISYKKITVSFLRTGRLFFCVLVDFHT